MTIDTVNGSTIDMDLLNNYLKNLVNLFFKILPMRENEEDSLPVYMKSLQSELIGCKEIITALNNDHLFLSLISILQYLIDNDCSVKDVRREVFNAISICNKLKTRYQRTEGSI